MHSLWGVISSLHWSNGHNFIQVILAWLSGADPVENLLCRMYLLYTFLNLFLSFCEFLGVVWNIVYVFFTELPVSWNLWNVCDFFCTEIFESLETGLDVSSRYYNNSKYGENLPIKVFLKEQIFLVKLKTKVILNQLFRTGQFSFVLKFTFLMYYRKSW